MPHGTEQTQVGHSRSEGVTRANTSNQNNSNNMEHENNHQCEACIYFENGAWCRLFKRRKATSDGERCRYYDYKTPQYQSPYL